MRWPRLLDLKRFIRATAIAAERAFISWVQPASSVAVGIARDVVRSRTELVAENAFLRQQLIVLQRHVPHPRFRAGERVTLVLFARLARGWRSALLLVQPATLLRWHREMFRRFWTKKYRNAVRQETIPQETIDLIESMAARNRLWGAERIRGELLKLGMHASKRTIQKYMRRARPRSTPGPTWRTFLREHAREMWACDFLQTYDALFRPLYAFVIVELATRRVVHAAATRNPTDAWTAQQLRNATPDAVGPRFLIRDRDAKFGLHFARVAAGSGIKIVLTPARTPDANAVCERLLGSLRRESLDHVLLLGRRHFDRVLREYVAYFNLERPHQGINQRIPDDHGESRATAGGRVVELPVLGGLHHAYRRAA
jgi:transposase InsO family protein